MRRLLATIALSLAMSAAGCSSTDVLSSGTSLSRSQYEARTAQIDARLRDQYEHAVVTVVRARRRGDAALGYDDEAAAFTEAAAALAGLNPPAELGRDHRQLIEGLRGLAGELRTVAADARAGRSVLARHLLAALPYSRPASSIRQATSAMRSRGYAVFVTR